MAVMLAKMAHRFQRAARCLQGAAAALSLFLLVVLCSPLQAAEPLKVGILTDLSSFGSDVTGHGSITAASLAVADFGGTVGDRRIEVLSADTQNRPDIAVALAREWIDQRNVDVIADLPQSAVSLAVQQLARSRGKIDLVTSGVTADLTRKACSPYAVHWAEDTNALAAGTVRELTANGAKDWFFIAADFAFGHTMQEAARATISRSGGTVSATLWPPVSTLDYSSFILSAKNSTADTVAFITVGNDFITSIKQAHEFGLAQSGKKIAGLVTYLSDVHGLGPEIAQGLYVTTSFYWDQNEASRRFAARFEAAEGRKPNKTHAALYTAVTHYLNAVKATGAEPEPAMRWMKNNSADYFGKTARIRPDGRALFDLDVYRVKGPGRQDKGPWDLYEKVGSLSADEAFAPIYKQVCDFLR